ncbi:MAG TPA: hypothetical protein DEQ28_08795 [Clostridiales bacterium]|nr:hypothetical protein [Clostridiales bacterium]
MSAVFAPSRGWTIREMLNVPAALRAVPEPIRLRRRVRQVPPDPGALDRALDRAAELGSAGYEDLRVLTPPGQYPVVAYRLPRGA